MRESNCTIENNKRNYYDWNSYPLESGLPLLMRESICTIENNKRKYERNKYNVSCEGDVGG